MDTQANKVVDSWSGPQRPGVGGVQSDCKQQGGQIATGQQGGAYGATMYPTPKTMYGNLKAQSKQFG